MIVIIQTKCTFEYLFVILKKKINAKKVKTVQNFKISNT